MSLEILKKLNNMLHVGLRFHDESQDLFNYLSLGGFSQLHFYQFQTERINQKTIKQLIISTYDIALQDNIISNANVLSLTKDKERRKLSLNERFTIIKTAFSEYEKFECNNLIEYENIAKSLSDNNNLALYTYVLSIVKDVKSELMFLSDIILAYESTDWDIPTIVQDQSDFYERYTYLLKQLHKNYDTFHHFNSALDKKSRGIKHGN